MHIDHFTIRTRHLTATKDFFLKIFDGLEEKKRPNAIQRIPGHWLYAGDNPIVHLIASDGYGIDDAAEAIDHVGIHLDGYTAFRARLDELDIHYSTMDLPEIDERRLFFRTPSGPLIEAVFKQAMPQSTDQETKL